MLIDSTNLIQVLDHNDGLVPVATLSGPVGDLTLQGPSGHINIPSVLSLAGGGVFSGTWTGSPTLSWTPTWSALQTFAGGLTVPNGSASISAPQYNTPGNTFTGTSNAIPPRLNLNLNLAGTISGQSYVNYLSVSGDNADGSLGANGGIWTLGLQHNVSGAAANGGRGLVWAQLNVGTVANPGQEMLGLASTIFAGPGCNGAFCQPLATSVIAQSGSVVGNTLCELMVSTVAGSSVGNKGFIQCTYGPNDAVSGSGMDAALVFASANFGNGTSPGGSMLVSAGNVGEGWPVAPTGTIFGSTVQTANQGAGRNAHFIVPKCFAGVDFSQVDFSQASGFAFRSGGFSVDGTGQTRVGNGVLGITTSGLKLDVDSQIVTAAAVAAGGGGGGSGTGDYYVGDLLYGSAGGIYRVATVSSGAVATVTVLVPGVSTSPPSNPIATTGGSGTGCTLNLTWSSSRTTLALNPSGGAVTFGGGTQNVMTVTPGTGSSGTITVTQSGTGGFDLVGMVKVDGTNILQVGTNFSLNNCFQFAPSAAAGTPAVSVVGNATDIPLQINTKGAGLLTLMSGGTGAVKLASTGAWSANGAVATALSSVGPTGSHTTVQEWLTITNSSGVVRYIPCF